MLYKAMASRLRSCLVNNDNGNFCPRDSSAASGLAQRPMLGVVLGLA